MAHRATGRRVMQASRPLRIRAAALPEDDGASAQCTANEAAASNRPGSRLPGGFGSRLPDRAVQPTTLRVATLTGRLRRAHMHRKERGGSDGRKRG